MSEQFIQLLEELAELGVKSLSRNEDDSWNAWEYTPSCFENLGVWVGRYSYKMIQNLNSEEIGRLIHEYKISNSLQLKDVFPDFFTIDWKDSLIGIWHLMDFIDSRMYQREHNEGQFKDYLTKI